MSPRLDEHLGKNAFVAAQRLQSLRAGSPAAPARRGPACRCRPSARSRTCRPARPRRAGHLPLRLEQLQEDLVRQPGQARSPGKKGLAPTAAGVGRFAMRVAPALSMRNPPLAPRAAHGATIIAGRMTRLSGLRSAPCSGARAPRAQSGTARARCRHCQCTREGWAPRVPRGRVPSSVFQDRAALDEAGGEVAEAVGARDVLACRLRILSRMGWQAARLAASPSSLPSFCLPKARRFAAPARRRHYSADPREA